MHQLRKKYIMDWMVFKNIQSPALIKHIKAVLSSEPEETHVKYKLYSSSYYTAIVLALKNKNEGYTHLHYFYMDVVDQNYDEYLYYSMPLSNFEHFVEHVKDFLTT
ncbi:hypothetical protein NDS46_29090 [Paenibacillus thiaminolyticus]|uniref:hypothetical protein n=1 Tax=Paenibacillus thiaminolyticus TaxID=49283 RepID=UPI00232F7194|nr:hypothetical protein [Paenibacillus thiaminolyticus]WCF08261.1 hypothetical protein NDS46_29090 [Paenibacillus thiaminolyticus]